MASFPLLSHHDSAMGSGLINGSDNGSQELKIGVGIDDKESVCRICLGTETDTDPLIWPCYCAPSHRSCLNDWRTSSYSGTSFTHCEICNYQYDLDPIPISEHQRRVRICRLYGYITRDLLVFLVLWQALIIFCAWLIFLIDSGKTIPRWFADHDWLELNTHNQRMIYYGCGFLLLSLILGGIALWYWTVNGYPWEKPKKQTSKSQQTPSSSSTNSGSSDCNCSGCDNTCTCPSSGGGGSGGGGEILAFCAILLLIIVAIAVVLFIVFGIFWLLSMGIAFFGWSVKYHTNKLWLVEESKLKPVHDYTKQRRLVKPSAPPAEPPAPPIESIL